MVRLSPASWTSSGAMPRIFFNRHPLDPVDTWLVPVVGPDEMFQPRGSCSPRPRRRGVNLRNLQPLSWAPRTADTAAPPVPARIGLVNARSLANKTFVLKDFFTSRGLDFLCVTETWLSVGESSAFTELLPQNCCYFNSRGRRAEVEELPLFLRVTINVNSCLYHPRSPVLN